MPLPQMFRQVVPATTRNPWSALLFLSGFDGRDETGTALYKRHRNVCPVRFVMTRIFAEI